MLSTQRDRARAEHRGHRQQRQLADPARRRHLARRDRKPDLRTRRPARPAACRGPARPARDLRLCPAQPGRDEVHAHDRRQRRAVEARRRRPPQQLTDRFAAMVRARPCPGHSWSRPDVHCTSAARPPLNLPGLCCDQEQAQSQAADASGVMLHEERSAGQYRSHPVAERSAARMGTIMIRFVGLLVVAVVVLALIWSR